MSTSFCWNFVRFEYVFVFIFHFFFCFVLLGKDMDNEETGRVRYGGGKIEERGREH